MARDFCMWGYSPALSDHPDCLPFWFTGCFNSLPHLDDLMPAPVVPRPDCEFKFCPWCGGQITWVIADQHLTGRAAGAVQ